MGDFQNPSQQGQNEYTRSTPADEQKLTVISLATLAQKVRQLYDQGHLFEAATTASVFTKINNQESLPSVVILASVFCKSCSDLLSQVSLDSAPVINLIETVKKDGAGTFVSSLSEEMPELDFYWNLICMLSSFDQNDPVSGFNHALAAVTVESKLEKDAFFAKQIFYCYLIAVNHLGCEQTDQSIGHFGQLTTKFYAFLNRSNALDEQTKILGFTKLAHILSEKDEYVQAEKVLGQAEAHWACQDDRSSPQQRELGSSIYFGMYMIARVNGDLEDAERYLEESEKLSTKSKQDRVHSLPELQSLNDKMFSADLSIKELEDLARQIIKVSNELDLNLPKRNRANTIYPSQLILTKSDSILKLNESVNLTEREKFEGMLLTGQTLFICAECPEDYNKVLLLLVEGIKLIGSEYIDCICNSGASSVFAQALSTSVLEISAYDSHVDQEKLCIEALIIIDPILNRLKENDPIHPDLPATLRSTVAILEKVGRYDDAKLNSKLADEIDFKLGRLDF